MYVILPFSISNNFAQESSTVNWGNLQNQVVMVNVGWISMKEYKLYGLRRIKLPSPENFQVVNNNRGMRLFALLRLYFALLWLYLGFTLLWFYFALALL